MERYCPSCDRSYAKAIDQCPEDGTSLIELAGDADPLVGRRIADRFTLQERLGAGGMGAVYKAWQHSVGRDVAIKVIHPRLGSEVAAAKRFLREVKLASRLSQPNTVAVYDFGQTEDGVLYFAMEYLRGMTLHQVLRSDGRFPPWRLVRVGTQLCDALQAAHGLGIVHRDLKPANIVILDDPPGRDLLKVLDFGLAKSLADDEGDASVTHTGVALGTPSYISPEAARGEKTDHRTDLYSLGVILAELVAGQLPFHAETPMEMIAQHLHADPVLPQGVPAPIARVLLRLMARAPADRYSSANQARAELMAAAKEARAHAPGGSNDGAAEWEASEPTVPRATLDPASARPMPAPARTPVPAEASSQGVTREERPARPELSAVPPVSPGRLLAGMGAALVLGLVGLSSIGYAAPMKRDFWGWMHIGGAPTWSVLILFVLGLGAAVHAAGRRMRGERPGSLVLWLALACAMAGATGTLLGAGAIDRGLAMLRPIDRLVRFNAGMFEANVVRFLGFAGAIQLYALAAMLDGGPAPEKPSRGVRWAATIAIGVELTLAGLGLALGAPGVTLVAAAAAVMLGTRRLFPETEWQPRAAAARWMAVWMSSDLVLARGVGFSTAVWRPELTHAQRAAEIVLRIDEWHVTFGLGVVALATLLAVEIWTVARGARSGGPRGTTWVYAASLILGATVDVVVHLRFMVQRGEMRQVMSAQFSRYARVEPPSTDLLGDPRFTPHRGPGLLLGRDVVALNGKGVARTGAQDLGAHLGDDLRHALADAAADPERTPEDADLSITVDRRVPYLHLVRVIEIARREGASRIELLFARGPATELPPGVPAEVDYLVPSDFMALPVKLGEGGYAPDPSAPFGAIASELVRRGLAGTEAVVLAPPPP